MTLYIGVDFHPYQQTVAWSDIVTGETDTIDFSNEEAASFFRGLEKPAVVGMEASCRAEWFERLLDGEGHRLLVGNPSLIRKRAISRHKNDRRDAELILELLLREEFPVIWRRTPEQNDILDVLRLRMKFVGQRTAVMNRLQALSRSRGLPRRKAKTTGFRQRLQDSGFEGAAALQRDHLLRMLENFNREILSLEEWLKAGAARDPRVKLLMTQPGVGYLTALSFVNILGDISRFTKVPKQVTSFIGLDPLEVSSAGKKRYGSISKKGSALVRFQLGQAAQIAARYDPKLRSFYKRLEKKKPKGVAKTAAARKLLVKLSIMLRDNISAQEFDRRGRTVGNARRSAGSEMTVA